jgi:hypothetical protein
VISLTCFSRPFVCTVGGVPAASADTREEAWGYILLQGFRSHTVISDEVRPQTFGGWDVVRRPEWLAQQARTTEAA